MIVAKSNKKTLYPINVGFDVNGDLNADIPAIANFAAGPSYTYSSDFVIRRNIGVLAYSRVWLQLRDSSNFNYGTATYNTGDLLASDPAISEDTEWSTTYNVVDYIGALSTIEDLGLFEFDKKTFAEDNSIVNTQAKELFVDAVIETASGVTVGSSTLTLEIHDSDGTYSNPRDISFSPNDNRFYVAEYAGDNNDISQNLVSPGYTTRSFAASNSITNCGRVKIDTSVNSIGDIFYSEGSAVKFAEGLSVNSDGFTVFDTPETLAASYFTIRGFTVLNEVVNGRSVLMTSGNGGGGSASAFRIYEWDGVSAWTRTLLSGGVFTGIGNTITNFDVSGTTVFVNDFYGSSSFRKLAAFTYTGDWKIAGNWTKVEIGDGAVAVASGGVLGGRGIHVDDTVVGYPDIYMCNEVDHTLVLISTVLAIPSGMGDFTITEVAGQTGVPGNADGIGTASTLTSPTGIDEKDGILYFTQYLGGNNIRSYNLATGQVLDFKGEYGVSGKDEFITF